VFVIAFFALSSSELPFKLVNSNSNTTGRVLASFFNNEDLVVFSSGDYFDTDVAGFVAINNDVNLIDTVIVPG